MNDIETQLRALPLQTSSSVLAKQNELDRLGTELWNLTTRLRRDETDPTDRSGHPNTYNKRTLPLLRAFAFLLLDSASGHGVQGRQRKNCIRLIKVAIKAAKACIQSNELGTATKVLECAADYEVVLSQEDQGKCREEIKLTEGLRIQYFAVRTTLVRAESYEQFESLNDDGHSLQYYRHGVMIAWTQQSTCSPNASSS